MWSFVALDRDGTLIEERPYLSDPAQVRLLPNTAAALRALRDAGLGLVVVTNQSGVGRGFFDLDTVSRVNERMLDLLAWEGATIDEIFICPHRPDERCACRKPRTLMLEMAAQRFGAAPAQAVVVGDKLCDIELGRRAGAITFLVRTGWGQETAAQPLARPHYLATDLLDAAQMILARQKAARPLQLTR